MTELRVINGVHQRWYTMDEHLALVRMCEELAEHNRKALALAKDKHKTATPTRKANKAQ